MQPFITDGNSTDFNPRSPYGERLKDELCEQDSMISIHAPLTGSDGAAPLKEVPPSVFQSTLPLRGAT